jgi:DNA-binding HxlR family transcriptional regulator
MKGYGQFCPIAKAAEVFCQRWTPLILRDLAGGASRFSQLQRGVPLASPTLLSRRLKELEAEGIVERRRSHAAGAWTYHLTPAGKEFVPIVMALGTWGQRWSRRELAPDEVNLDLFLWAMENTVDPMAFGKRRTVIELVLDDQPAHKSRWWFINENGACELCVREPGFEIDLYVMSNLPDMIRIWRGDLSLRAVISAGRLETHGRAKLVKAFPDWLSVSTLAHVAPARDAAHREAAE